MNFWDQLDQLMERYSRAQLIPLLAYSALAAIGLFLAGLVVGVLLCGWQ